MLNAIGEIEFGVLMTSPRGPIIKELLKNKIELDMAWVHIESLQGKIQKMKVTIEYAEKEEARLAMCAGDLLRCIDEVDSYIRSRIKYEDLSEEVSEALQKVRDLLHEHKPRVGE